MKKHITKLTMVAAALLIMSCNPDDDNNSSSNSGGGGGNGGGTTSGSSTHTCGAEDLHNPEVSYGTMTDQEGNSYKTVVLGQKEWMAENLNTSKFRNGDPIPQELSSEEVPGWDYYNSNSVYECPFGKLYNWYACTDSRELCPTGWHVPDDNDWSSIPVTVRDNLFTSNTDYAMQDLVQFQQDPNEAGFSAVGVGIWLSGAGTEGYWTPIPYYWSTDENTQQPVDIYGDYGHYWLPGNDLSGDMTKRSRLMVRCVRD
jgi:uncharacterized protein (TIGR02145 family)